MPRYLTPYGDFRWVPLGLRLMRRCPVAKLAAFLLNSTAIAAVAGLWGGPFAGAFAALCMAALLPVYVRALWRERRTRTERLARIGGIILSRLPDDITLAREQNHVWKDPDAVAAASRPLLGLGFRLCGVYRASENPPFLLLLKEAEALYAYVRERATGEIGVDIATDYADGTSLLVSNQIQLDPVAEFDEICRPGLSPEELYRLLMSERRDKPFKALTEANFVSEYEAGYSRKIRAMKQRGLRAPEVRRILERPPGKPPA